eukprot:TRINITY_DN106299_c0_g1_i1.p1 TRINITY_DN106299_c0_g1~~TRINITY_DN106299_c0_g1_i1.p1  ORF type:complete len:255 (+),score=40.42 TRINITY_DN106299_c0_g1_i1:1070-1834(+)
MGYALYTLYGHEGATTAVNFSPDGDYLCSGGADSVVMVWLSNLDYSSNAPVPTVNADLTIKTNKKLVTESAIKATPGRYPAPISPQRYEEEKALMVHPELPSAKAQVVTAPPRHPEGEGSEELAGRLDKVVAQLNIITKTLNILEQRMRVTEGQVGQLMDQAAERNFAMRGMEEGRVGDPGEYRGILVAPEEKYREPEDIVGYRSGTFKGETLGQPGGQIEARLDEPLGGGARDIYEKEDQQFETKHLLIITIH